MYDFVELSNNANENNRVYIFNSLHLITNHGRLPRKRLGKNIINRKQTNNYQNYLKA